MKNMKRLIATLLACIIMIMMLASCGTDTDTDTNSEVEWDLVWVESNNHHDSIIMEPVTGVLYLAYSNTSGAGLTVMLDPETGLPLTYDRYMEMKEAK